VGTTGGVIAFAMECFEKGLLTIRDTGGLDLSWGNYHAILQLIEMIAYRQGFGNTLALGFGEAVKEIGPESGNYAIQIKGMDPPTFDPRALKVYNFRYAVASRGADHLRISAHGAYELEVSEPAQATQKLKFWQDIVCIPDIAGVCKFPYTFYSQSADVTMKKALQLVPLLIESAAGVKMDSGMIMDIAKRVALTERAFNNRLGLTAEQDYLPERFLKDELPSGRAKGQKYDVFDTMKAGYYAACGWDQETGVPKRETMEQAGLHDIAEDLEKHDIIIK
jgi:aldehyde:ferredoxin oxidoreductase